MRELTEQEIDALCQSANPNVLAVRALAEEVRWYRRREAERAAKPSPECANPSNPEGAAEAGVDTSRWEL